MEQSIIVKIQRYMVSGEWSTVKQVASGVGQASNSTVRAILDTMAYYGICEREWGWTGKQHAFFYRMTAVSDFVPDGQLLLSEEFAR